MSASPQSLRLAEIGQIALTVRDLDRATRFYRDTLGIEPLFQVPGMSFFRCGGVRLLLGLPEDDAEVTTSHVIYYRVDDINAAHRVLVEAGVEFIHDPRPAHRDDRHELWLAFFRDPDGHTLALMSEVPV